MATLTLLQSGIVAMLKEFKAVWGRFSKSSCAFLKYHLALHLTWVIKFYGSLRAVDTAHGEGVNKDVKRLYRSTNRKAHDRSLQMHAVTVRKNYAEATARALGAFFRSSSLNVCFFLPRPAAAVCTLTHTLLPLPRSDVPGIQLKRAPTNRGSQDRMTGVAAEFNLATGSTRPHRGLLAAAARMREFRKKRKAGAQGVAEQEGI